MKLFEGLRIGLIGPLAPPAGGMANQTQQLAELLLAEQASVVMVQTNRPYFPAMAGRIPGLRALFRLMPYLLALWRAAGQVDLFHLMANSGWAWHLFSMPAIWIAYARGVPVVVNYRGGEAEEFLERSHALVRWSMRHAAALAVPSGFLEQIFRRHGMHPVVVPNVIDLARFHPREAAVPPGPPGRHIVVARNLEPLYDNATALRAFAGIRQRFADATLTIAGSGPEAAGLQQLAVELGVRDAVHFVGRLDRERMADLYRRCDICLNPSLADNMPNSLLEAMASGLPVVSTAVGGVPFMVSEGVTALLVPAGDPRAMADGVIKLFEDVALWRRLATAGLSEVQRYTWPRVAPALGEVYRRATTGRA